MIFMGVEWGEGWVFEKDRYVHGRLWKELDTPAGGWGSVMVLSEASGGCSVRVADRQVAGKYLAYDEPPEAALAKYVEYLLKGGDRAVVGN